MVSLSSLFVKWLASVLTDVFLVDEWTNAYIDYYSDAQCLQLTTSGVPFDQDQVQCQKTDSAVVTDPSKPNGNVYSQMFISTSATPPRISDAGGGLFE